MSRITSALGAIVLAACLALVAPIGHAAATPNASSMHVQAAVVARAAQHVAQQQSEALRRDLDLRRQRRAAEARTTSKTGPPRAREDVRGDTRQP